MPQRIVNNSPSMDADLAGAMDDLIERLISSDARSGSVMLSAPEGADGDSLGSQLGLAAILETRFPRLEIAIVNADAAPRRYRGLPGVDRLRRPEELDGRRFDIAMVLDGGRARMGDAGALFDAAGTRVLFDHHVIGDDCEYDLRVVDSSAAATAEMVDHLRRHPAIDVPLTTTIAEPLYAALIFDTGCFRHSSTTSGTLTLASELIATGFDFTRVVEETMLLRRFAGLELMARVVSRARAIAGGRVIMATMTISDLEASGADSEDREGIIEQLFLVDSCRIAALVSEKAGATPSLRCSFRSRGEADVAALARSLSSHGGGHRKAAGCALEGTLEEWEPRLVRALERAVEEGAS